jgi:hypothetical protein
VKLKADDTEKARFGGHDPDEGFDQLKVQTHQGRPRGPHTPEMFHGRACRRSGKALQSEQNGISMRMTPGRQESTIRQARRTVVIDSLPGQDRQGARLLLTLGGISTLSCDFWPWRSIGVPVSTSPPGFEDRAKEILAPAIQVPPLRTAQAIMAANTLQGAPYCQAILLFGPKTLLPRRRHRRNPTSQQHHRIYRFHRVVHESSVPPTTVCVIAA